MKKYSESEAIREPQMEPHWCNISPIQLEWLSLNIQKIANAGEDMEKKVY